MANIIGIQDLVDGPRHLHVKVDIQGDGSGDDTVVIADAGLKNCGEFRLDGIWGRLEGFTAHLEWAGATPVTFLQVPNDDEIRMSWERQGGLTNPKVANYTGDVHLVTSGLGAGEVGTITLDFIKKRKVRRDLL